MDPKKDSVSVGGLTGSIGNQGDIDSFRSHPQFTNYEKAGFPKGESVQGLTLWLEEQGINVRDASTGATGDTSNISGRTGRDNDQPTLST